MKNKLQQFWRAAVLAAVVLLAGCAKDEFEDPIRESSIKAESFSISSVLLQSAEVDGKQREASTPKMQKLVNALTNAKAKLSNKKNVQGKIVYDADSGIYFDDEAGIKLTKEDYESYTFKILKEQEAENAKLENIVFVKNQAEDFDAYWVKYNFTEEQLKQMSAQEIENSPKEYYSLRYGAPEILCIDYVIYTTSILYGDGTGVNSINYVTVANTISSECFNMGSDIESSSSSGSNTGPGGGYGGPGYPNSSTPTYNGPLNILTAPVHGIQEVNHLLDLYQITNKPTTGQPANPFLNRILSYNNALPTATQEMGVEFRRGAVTNGVPSYYTVDPLSAGYNYVEFTDPAANTVLYIHLHHDHEQNGKGLSPVFSDGDFFAFASNFEKMGQSSGRKRLTSILVSKNGLYAMRVASVEQLNAFIAWLHDPENLKKFEIKFDSSVIKKSKTKAMEIFNAQGGGTQAQYDAIEAQQFEKWLVRFLEDFARDYDGGTGIILFKGTIANGNVTWNSL